MPFHSKALSAALGIIATAAVIAPGHAQQNPPQAGQEPVPNASPQESPATPAPPFRAPARTARAGAASVVAAVNLRSGPGTDQEIITTIPGGSTVQVSGCTGEWCEVTWNGRSGYAIARNLSIGAPRQARPYGPQPGYAPQPGYPGGRQPGYAGGYGPQPGYTGGYGPEPPAVYEAPGYYAPPAVVYGPGYYGPGAAYYGPGWRRRWW
jgi:SH3 domain-containing protein